VVPIDVVLADDIHLLVITGPNTGGKTVALKTVGLLTAMAQSGLRIPAAEGSTVPVFKQIFADIGDEQSIEQSLSTFSGHMTNVVRILHQCDARSLVIFDELGAGTDPIEGSALARAILSQLLRRHVTTFVATHYSELKAYAHTTPGVVNASMEFNVETLTPTYRLRIGLPGASNAFTIARRLGLPESIINAARGLVSEDARQVEAMLAEIKAQTEAAHRVRQLAETEQQKVEDVTRQLQEQLKEIDAERRNILNTARADARREIKAARERIRALEELAKSTIDEKLAAVTAIPEPDALKVQTDLAELDHLEAAITPEAEPAPPPPEPAPTAKLRGPIRVGDTVYVPQFATTAEVVGLQNSQAEVQLGRFRSTVPVKTLELRARAAAQPEKSPLPTLSADVGETESPGLELDLRGQMVDEAMFNLDQYLDKAFLASLPSVSVIHGRGSGALRQVVRVELRGHPLVSSYRPGKEGEGGDGITVVFLAIH
jgi:DNA mismatch repair protein MutS2